MVYSSYCAAGLPDPNKGHSDTECSCEYFIIGKHPKVNLIKEKHEEERKFARIDSTIYQPTNDNLSNLIEDSIICESELNNEINESGNNAYSSYGYAIPKALIERSIRPENFNLKDNKQHVAELVAKLGSDSSENSNVSPPLKDESLNDTSLIEGFHIGKPMENLIVSSDALSDMGFKKALFHENGLKEKQKNHHINSVREEEASISMRFGLKPFGHQKNNVKKKPIWHTAPPNYYNKACIDSKLINFIPQYASNVSVHSPNDIYHQEMTTYKAIGETSGMALRPTAFQYCFPPSHGYCMRSSTDINTQSSYKIRGKNTIFLESPTQAYDNFINDVRDGILGEKNCRLDYENDLRTKLIEPSIQSKEPLDIDMDIELTSVEMARDQHGSRLIQHRIETASSSDISILITELIDDEKIFVILVGDVFGNYVVQKLLDYGDEEHRQIIVRKIRGSILFLTMQMYGCRVIQKAIECGTLFIQLLIINELKTHVIECIRDQNGNHVIQKCIEKIECNKLDFIIYEIGGKVVELSTHPYGCRVIQRIMERFNDKQKDYITNELFSEIPLLVLDQYGNYVVQHILDHRKIESDRYFIYKYVKENICLLSSHKFASNVVEKCLVSGTKEERKDLISEIIDKSVGLEDDVIYKMMKDAYANYVIQKMIDVIIFDKEHDLFESLVSKIKPHFPNLRKINYGKHIMNKIDKICTKLSNKEPKYDNIEEYPLSSNASRFIEANSPKLIIINRDCDICSEKKLVICDSLTEFPNLIQKQKLMITSD